MVFTMNNPNTAPYANSSEWVHIDEVNRLKSRITELEAELSEAYDAALVDHLTSALNRRGFELLMEQEWDRVQRENFHERHTSFSLLYLDIDKFKDVNDYHGHHAGDAVLKELSSSMIGRLRDSDIFARIGGDEFVICLVGTEVNEAQAIRTELQEILSDNSLRLDDGTELSFSVSIGLAGYDEQENWMAVLREADAQLYEEKA